MGKHRSHPKVAGSGLNGVAGWPGPPPASLRALDQARTALGFRLRQRSSEIEAAVSTRIYAISDPCDVPDPDYLQGLNSALVAAIEYRLSVLEVGDRSAPPVPAALLEHARLDARDRVPLDTVLRRYFAGNTLFGDFLVEEAERAEIPNPALRQLLATQATLGDRLLAAVSAEYAREVENRPKSGAERRRDCVKRLLAGELADPSELDYDLDAHHLAMMAKGEGAQELMRDLARRLDRRLLAVCREEHSVWACWLGGRGPLAAEDGVRVLGEISLNRVIVTVGEPGKGLAGWRFSHRQAKTALPIAERRRQPILRYADVAILASILRDDLLAGSLRTLYLEPLENARDGGEVARDTLRAYFSTGQNSSAAAASLGVDRRTVTNRLHAVEELFGAPLTDVGVELEIALRLAD